MSPLLKKIFGTSNDRTIKTLFKEVKKINSLEPAISNLSDSELQNMTDKFRKRLNSGENLNDILYEAFAVVREASKRVLNMRHYDVQLIGGIILHRGMISEQRTGEGKTLVATLPAYLNALSGKGVHIVTINDYLAQRDSNWKSKIFNFLGLTVGCVTHSLDEQSRKLAYAQDITYVTNNELGFDFLKDNMKYTIESKVLRPLNFAIIDEVDSILIDESRTPLIISGPANDDYKLYDKINLVVKTLTQEDYEKDEKTRTIHLTEHGTNKLESILLDQQLISPNSSLYDIENLNLLHQINQSLKAHQLFTANVHYLVKDNQVMIIDEFTGRVMSGRRYSDGLHQSLESKENVPIQNESQTLASITFQNYFRMYPKISGMTGTAMTEAAELKHIYNLDVISVPTAKKTIRKDHDDAIYGNKNDKYNAIIHLVKERHEKGQPMLIGTISIENSEEISELLSKAGIKHNVLNAKFHEQEAHIIAQAGRYKAVTIATNMAGRGTDIMLGGNPDMIIDQANTDNNLSTDQYEKQLSAIKQDVEQEKIKVIEAGGLFVIGTERHESRRIDNQLRGRSARQGDPGETKFFLSLEDDLMRIFASDRISGILRTLGLKDGEAIHHPIITRSIEKAQQKVEGNNYEIRKNLLKFDDVINEQRQVIYTQRHEIMESQNPFEFLEIVAERLINDTVLQFIAHDAYKEDWQLDGLAQETQRIFNISINPKEMLKQDITEKDITKDLVKRVQELYKKKKDEYSTQTVKEVSLYVLLTTIDQCWKDHLHNLDHLRQGIVLRAYGQKDPLNEYKKEAFLLFKHMLDSFRELSVQRMCYLHIDTQRVDNQNISLKNKRLESLTETREDPAFNKYSPASNVVDVKATPFKSYIDPKERNPNDSSTWGKIARNETCPCGSGKKYKNCHGTYRE
ncbi:MAG: preprotein translocase subunit SecA [Rickettsiaceae bacterium]